MFNPYWEVECSDCGKIIAYTTSAEPRPWLSCPTCKDLEEQDMENQEDTDHE